MELVTTGKVAVTAMIEDLSDLHVAGRNLPDPALIRRITVDDALVDTGASSLSMPKTLIEQLGLKRDKTRSARTGAGVLEFGIYEAARLTIQGRDCSVDVMEIANGCPVLIGQLASECLYFIRDTSAYRLIGSPDHNGEHMFDLL